MKNDGFVEGYLLVKNQDHGINTKKRNKKIQGQNSEDFAKIKKSSYPPFWHCEEKVTLFLNVGGYLMQNSASANNRVIKL